MGWLSKRPDTTPTPFVQVPRGPRGGLNGRYFVLVGSPQRQTAWRRATSRLKLKLPRDTAERIPVQVTLRIGSYGNHAPRVGVELGGIEVGTVPWDDAERVAQVMRNTGSAVVTAEAVIYRSAASNGWNGRVII